MTRELHVYDLDETLYDSPPPPNGEGNAWYALPTSLADAGVPGFDPRWRLPVLQQARRSINDPTVKTALLTARTHNAWLHRHISSWLMASGLHFDIIQLRPVALTHTPTYKAMAILHWLELNPTIESVVFWDDDPENREMAGQAVSKTGRRILLPIP